MFAYNAFQVVFNVWTVYAIIRQVTINNLNVFNNSNTPTYPALNKIIWFHYLNKYAELADTAFMILRKKNSQISFLHMYHHILMIWSWFLNFYIDPCTDGFFGAAVNSFIHVLMYSYYLCASLGWSCPWKRHLTKAQLGQFVMCGIHGAYGGWTGRCHPVLVGIQIWAMVSFFVLFSQFYFKKYASCAGIKMS